MMQSCIEIGNFYPLKFWNKMLKHDYIWKDSNLLVACWLREDRLGINGVTGFGTTQPMGWVLWDPSFAVWALWLVNVMFKNNNLKHKQTKPQNVLKLSDALWVQPALKRSPAHGPALLLLHLQNQIPAGINHLPRSRDEASRWGLCWALVRCWGRSASSSSHAGVVGQHPAAPGQWAVLWCGLSARQSQIFSVTHTVARSGCCCGTGVPPSWVMSSWSSPIPSAKTPFNPTCPTKQPLWG